LPQRDGVNFAHENMTWLLKHRSGPALNVHFHDFNRLLSDDSYAVEMLANADCVVSNVGPHAHYYFYLREHLRLSYRIVRDVHTALWSGYLFQEFLCHPFLRYDDTLLVPSRYARGVFEAIFPGLKHFPSLLSHPLAVCFPERERILSKRSRNTDADLILGYLGRISEDKNFPDLVRLLIELNQETKSLSSRRYRLFACGHNHSSSCEPHLVDQMLVQALGISDVYSYSPARSSAEIWDFLARIDVLLFPTTSNLETLGRVLIEASYAGLPVICSDHAAASELIEPEYLCPVQYRRGLVYSCHSDHSLGSVDLEWMKRCLLERELKPTTCYESYLCHPDRLIDALSTTGSELRTLCEPLVLAESQHAFIRSIAISMPSFAHRPSESLGLIASLIPWFLGLQGLVPAVSRKNWIQRLVGLTAHPVRTARFIERTRNTSQDFTDVGAIDIELCNVANFLPTFSLD